MRRALASLEGIISEQLSIMMTDLVEHNEPAIAYEDLCSELYEYDTAIPADTWKLLSELGELMKLRPYYWDEIGILD